MADSPKPEHSTERSTEHSTEHGTNHSRRGFLKSASTTAAVAGAGLAGASLLTANDASARPAAAKATTAPEQATEPLVAYVRDAHSGEIAVMVGDRQVVVHDKDLAARIARAAY